MQRILRLLAPLALLIAALALVACGGDDKSSDTGGKAVKSDNAQDILAQTFSSNSGKKVESGKIDLTATINASGAGTSNLNGPINIKLSGPFQSMGKGKVPKFDMKAEFSGAGQNIKAGAVSTGDKGFINFNGQDYAVDDATFKQFASGYTQSQKQQTSPTNLKSLGLNPQDWLKDAKVDGDSDVGGTDTVKVTGTVDVPKLLTDVNTFLSKAGSLGIPNTGTLPSKLTDDQIKQVESSVKSSSVEIETGKDDSILRRMAFKLSVADSSGSGGKADIDFDISLTDLGEDQSVEAPSNTKPLNDLLGQLGGLGGLGALGGASGSSSGSGSSGAAGGVDKDAAAKYTQCVQDAGSDTSKLQDCSSLLTP